MKPCWQQDGNKIYQGDALEVLKSMPDGCVQMCVTSPPYWGLRDYGIDGQLGLEKTPEEYVEKMVQIFREVRRVLRKNGTLWLNMGDSYWGGKGKSGQAWSTENQERKTIQGSQHQITGMGETRPSDGKHEIIKPKDLVGIPWALAFALRADGWWLRSDIIWNKPNPMPESVTDRPTKAHEYMFLLTKSAKYFYDADAVKEPQVTRLDDKAHHAFGTPGGKVDQTPGKTRKESGKKWDNKGNGRNKRTVWTIPTKPFPKAHFATFPPALVEPCILAGTSEKGCCVECGSPWERVVDKKKIPRNELPKADSRYRPNRYIKNKYADELREGYECGMYSESKTIGWKPTCKCKTEIKPCIVLDPFFGSGTTAIVAHKHGRKFIGIELSKPYLDDIAIPRIKKETEQLKLWN